MFVSHRTNPNKSLEVHLLLTVLTQMNITKSNKFSPITVTNIDIVDDEIGVDLTDDWRRVGRRPRSSDVERVVWICLRHGVLVNRRRRTVGDKFTIGIQLESKLRVPRYLDEVPVVQLDAVP